MKKLLGSPITVLPLAFGALGLSLVPFALWNTEHAAQFYGSFFAAMVAAIAAFSGYFIQNKLAEERDEKAAQTKHLNECVDLFFRLRHVQTCLERAVKALEKRLETGGTPPNESEPFLLYRT